MKLPSKELASAVLGNKIVSCDISKNELRYSLIECRAIDDCEENLYTVNIYEFANLVKKYMCDNKIAIIKSSKSANYGWFAESLLTGVVSADTEPEAIFKAGDYILNETKN